MSSGIRYKYFIATESQAEPYVAFTYGIEWADGEPNKAWVGHVAGFSGVRFAYSDIPGLSGDRQLWLRTELFGGKCVANYVSNNLLTGDPLPTVGEYLSLKMWKGFGEELSSWAGIDPQRSLEKEWVRLARAAEKFPKDKWNHKHITRLKITSVSGKELAGEHAREALAACTAFSRCDYSSIQQSARDALKTANIKREYSLVRGYAPR